jgi:hypothetical protein
MGGSASNTSRAPDAPNRKGDVMRIVRKLAVLLLVSLPIGTVLGSTQAGALGRSNLVWIGTRFVECDPSPTTLCFYNPVNQTNVNSLSFSAQHGRLFDTRVIITGGFGDDTFSVVPDSGRIPGLFLSPDGYLSGTTGAVGSYSMWVQVTDSNQDVMTGQINFVIGTGLNPGIGGGFGLMSSTPWSR